MCVYFILLNYKNEIRFDKHIKPYDDNLVLERKSK